MRRQSYQSDHYLASILAQASDGILSTDDTGAVQTWNAAAERLFGYPAPAILGRRLDTLTPARRLRDQPEKSLADVAADVRASGSARSEDVVCRRQDGTSVAVSASVAPIMGDDGRTLGLSVIAHDVSDRLRMEAALREANRQKDAFLAVMSHELRTPLTSILGYTDLVLRGVAGALPSRATQYLQSVRGASGRLLELVNGLLEYSRLEAGAERLDLRSADLGRVLDLAVEGVRQEAADKRQRLEAVAEPDVSVLVDLDKVELILRNLLSNAVKFTPEGGQIRVGAGRDPGSPDQVRITVTDSGIGLSTDQVEQVWERFYQVDSSLTRKHGGIGLGLAVARHLVELHGGRTWATSPGLGRGSTFGLSLPLARDARGGSRESGRDLPRDSRLRSPGS